MYKRVLQSNFQRLVFSSSYAAGSAFFRRLTGLRSKRYFQEAFEEMFVRALRIGIDLSCLFFDLDHFKKVNDSCGHGFGDYVLKTVGALIKKNVRGGDLAARFGGEEFIVALPSTNLENALFVAEKIRALVESHRFSEQGQQWPVTTSIGVASLHVHRPKTAADLLQLADQALYRAKGTGRNRVEPYPA
jgi:two-component system cell cycle response regulator